MSDYSFKIEEIQNPTIDPAVPNPYGAKSFETIKYHTPITPKENVLRLYKGEKPLWMPSYYFDINFIQPLVMPDATARCNGGIDWFGIEWEYEPKTNAAMVKPGTRRLDDITNWESLIFPDLSAIDWQKDYEENYAKVIDPDKATIFTIVNGLFERTADLTSFEDTFCYLLEEEEALEAFYTKLTDFHIALMKIAKEVYHADIITFHDDMGTQRSSFFSPTTFEEVMLPHYKRMNDAAHEMGLYVNFHSCGCVGNQIENFIASGFDSWEGQDACNDKVGIFAHYFHCKGDYDHIAQLVYGLKIKEKYSFHTVLPYVNELAAAKVLSQQHTEHGRHLGVFYLPVCNVYPCGICTCADKHPAASRSRSYCNNSLLLGGLIDLFYSSAHKRLKLLLYRQEKRSVKSHLYQFLSYRQVCFSFSYYAACHVINLFSFINKHLE